MALKPNYGTHVPVLHKLLDITSGPVLELGVGYFSTPMLHWLCLSQKRMLVSYDNDPKFFAEFAKLEHQYHKLFLVEDWGKSDFDLLWWDIVLVDHGPSQRRSIDAVRLKDTARYIVLHDTHYKQEKHYNYYPIFPLFKYRWDYKEFHPTYATIVSNFVDLTDFHL